MIKYKCLQCGTTWYSAAKQDKPCKCGGVLVEQHKVEDVPFGECDPEHFFGDGKGVKL